MHALKRVLMVVFLGVGLIALDANASPFTASDLVSLNRLSDPVVSPDGRFVAYVVRETDVEKNTSQADIWVLDLANPNTPPKRLTANDTNDVSPRWGPNGESLYFLSNRTGHYQLYMIQANGGEAEQLTSYPVDMELFKVSRNGTTLVFTGFVYPQCRNLQCTATRYKLLQEEPEKGLAYDSLMVRYWDAWRDGRMSRLFAVPLEKNGRPSKEEPVSLMGDLNAAVPAYQLTGSETFDVSPDGKTVYFSTKIRGHDEPWSVNFDIYMVPSDGSRAPRNLTRDNPGSDLDPLVSPDGRWLAWRATDEDKNWTEQPKVRVLNLASGMVKTLTQNWDRAATRLSFTRDSRALLVITDNLGQQALWRVPMDGDAPAILVGQGSVGDAEDSAYGVVYTHSDLVRPPDLFKRVSNDPAIPVAALPMQLTAVNQDKLAGIEMGGFEQFSFEGAEGDTVYAYIVKPINFDPNKKYPVAFFIHGGPHSSMGNSFNVRWNPQVYAGAGFASVFIDYHGSSGYGQKFLDATRGERGAIVVDDLKAGLEAALAKYPWLDGKNVCGLGSSFGGYIAYLIEGAWPERFNCLVALDGMFDNRMKYFTSDLIGYLEEGFGGKPYFEDMKAHEQGNPATLVANWKTPLLVIHGEKDFRVPITQGIAAFTAAQRKGVPSRFLRFPDEDHWILGAANSIQLNREVLRWLKKWTGPEG